MLDTAKSHVTKGMLLRLLETVGEDTIFKIGYQSILDLEEDWKAENFSDVRSLSFFKENDKTVVVFGFDYEGPTG